jgi:hypothetical protein
MAQNSIIKDNYLKNGLKNGLKIEQLFNVQHSEQ